MLKQGCQTHFSYRVTGRKIYSYAGQTAQIMVYHLENRFVLTLTKMGQTTSLLIINPYKLFENSEDNKHTILSD